MLPNHRIFIAGAKTLPGSGLSRRMRELGFDQAVTEIEAGISLANEGEIAFFFKDWRPDYVFLMGESSGGIRANQKYPADLLYQNLLAQSLVIHQAFLSYVKKLFFLASSCVYPKVCPQPMRVESLMSGVLEPTSASYSMAKLAGIEMCRAYRSQYGVEFISGISADPFGPGDDFISEDSHVAAALMRKMHQAKIENREYAEIWGSGKPTRDFIFVDDLSDACIFLMKEYSGEELVNLSAGWVLSIRELAELLQEITGYQGSLKFNPAYPDGTPVKTLDGSKLRAMGWKPSIDIKTALRRTYKAMVRDRSMTAEQTCP